MYGILVLIISLGQRLIWLERIPSTINGDESGSLIHPWQISRGQLKPLQLTHDGSIPALVYYPMVWTNGVLGENRALLSARLVTIGYSVAALYLIFLILSQQVRPELAALTTLLLASSYWYLMFSRLAWVAMGNVFFAWWLTYETKQLLAGGGRGWGAIRWALAAGGNFISYMGGRLFLPVMWGWMFWGWLKGEKLKKRRILIAWILSMGLCLPFGWTIAEGFSTYMLRAKSVSIGKQVDGEKIGIITAYKRQLVFAIRGFILFDERVTHQGIENQRLIPMKSAVNRVLIPVVVAGFGMMIIDGVWIPCLVLYGLNLFILQSMSVLTPSWSRGLSYLPIIYLGFGYGLKYLWKIVEGFGWKKWGFGVIILGCIWIGVEDIQTYFDYVTSVDFKIAQQPAIGMDEYPKWSKAMRSWLDQGNLPFSYYDWGENDFGQRLQ